ncbi:unnamed protein product [Polarella glacialis]|uniref:Uncharacterized protein n=1 Tax=Polarella glacialis TaxID=89957 RepID=A0A813IIE4_POLGL|nr:unnamed protein product [Polarella glacialis]
MPLAYEIAELAAVQPMPGSHSEVPATSWLVETQQCKAAESLSSPLLFRASGWQGDVSLASQVIRCLDMAVCASRLLCFTLRVPKLQRIIRCRQAAWSGSRPGRTLRLPCSVLFPPSLCSLPVISRDVPELRTSNRNSTSTGTLLISFGIIGSGRKEHQVVQLASYGLNRMVVTAVDV